MNHLSEIPKQLGATYSSAPLDFESVVPLLLLDFPLNRERCAGLHQTVSEAMMKRSFSQCSAM
jgi:hypothetical protein